MDLQSDYEPSLCPFNLQQTETCPRKSAHHFCRRVWSPFILLSDEIYTFKGSSAPQFKEMKRNFLLLGICISTNTGYIMLYIVLHVLWWWYKRGKKQNTSLLKDVQRIWCLKEPNLICPSGRNLITQRQCLLYLPIYLLLTGLCDCLNDTCIDSHFIYISTLLQRVIIAFQLR